VKAAQHKKKRVEVDGKAEEGERAGVVADSGQGEGGAEGAPSPFRRMTEGQRRLQEAMLAQFAKK
jgi:hypothetical protein